MSFQMKYSIRQDLLPNNTKRRSGIRMPRVGFLVAHDTGNPSSTAQGNVNYYRNSANSMSASAHLFVDDKDIIECIPAFKNPEKAWHVMYDKPKDNQLFGDDANDIAVGVELCYNGKINNEESYKRYVWTLAYLCYVYGLNPLKHIVGHHILDPQRKTDPVNALRQMGKTYDGLLQDVDRELKACQGQTTVSTSSVTSYDNESLVDYLSRIGIDSSFTNRSKLAAENGIIGYKGAAEQNLELLNKLKQAEVNATSTVNNIPEEELSMRMVDLIGEAKMDELAKIYQDARVEGILSSTEWEIFAWNRSLTVGQAIYIGTVINDRRYRKAHQ